MQATSIFAEIFQEGTDLGPRGPQGRGLLLLHRLLARGGHFQLRAGNHPLEPDPDRRDLDWIKQWIWIWIWIWIRIWIESRRWIRVGHGVVVRTSGGLQLDLPGQRQLRRRVEGDRFFISKELIEKKCRRRQLHFRCGESGIYQIRG